MNITHNNNRYTSSSAYPQNKHQDQSALSSPDHNSLETNNQNGSKGYNYNSCDSETPLFHRKEGASQFIIQREGSGRLKAFLEEADGSRFPILLKGFPERIASDKTDALRHLFAHTHIKRTGLFADFSPGLPAGGGDKRKRGSKDFDQPLKVQKTTENQELVANQFDPSKIFFSITQGFKNWLSSSGRTLNIKVNGKKIDLNGPLLSHYEVYKLSPSGILSDPQLNYWKNILSINEKLYKREFIGKAINEKDPLCCFLISQDLKSVDSITFKYFLQNLPYYCNLDATGNKLTQEINDCLRRYIKDLTLDIQLINDPDNQNGRNIYEAALLKFFDSPKDDDFSFIEEEKSFIQEISFIFFKASADFGFAPSQYSLSLNCRNLEEEQKYNEILFENHSVQPAQYFLKSLFEGHWEAIRDIQFMGVFDPGLSQWGFFTYKPLELKLSAKIIYHQLQLILNHFSINVDPSSPHSKDDFEKNKEGFKLLFQYYSKNKITFNEPLLELTRSILDYSEEKLSFIVRGPIKIIKNCLDLFYSQMAIDKLQCEPRESLFPFIRNKDNSFYQPKMIYESNILNAQECIENIKNEDFKKYSYLGLAKLIAGFGSLYSGTPNVSELNVEKIVEHFVKKSDNIPELTYYMLIKGAVNKILSPVIPITPLEDDSPAAKKRYEEDKERYEKEIEDKKFYENKIPEYLSKIGPLGNLAMFEIQKRNISIQLNDQNSEIRKEFIKKEAKWNKKYYGAASADNERKDFIKDKLIPELLNWGFSAEYIKTHVFINRFLIEKINTQAGLAPGDQQSNAVLIERKRLIKELSELIKSSLADSSAKFDSHFNLNIKPKLILKLNREEQLRQFLDKEKIDNSQFIQNYSLLVKKISKDTIALVEELCENIQQSLGIPPTNFEIFTLGSLARRESGFYTDFEVGIVLEKNSIAAQIYFEEFSQKLADSLFMLEEHPDVGMHGAHLDTADNAPPHKRFEFRDFSDDKIMKQIRNAVGYRRKDDIPTAGSRIYLLTAEDFANLFKHNVLESLDSGSIELSSSYSEKLEIIQAAFYIEINNFNGKKLGFNKNIFYKHVDKSGNLKNRILKALKDIQHIINPIVLDSKKSLFDSEWGSELLRLAKKEIKWQLVEDYIEYDAKINNVDLTKLHPIERLRLTTRLTKKALPYVKKILNPLTPREVGVARSVPELGRNLDKVYTYKEDQPFNLLQTRDNFFNESIPCQGLGIQLKDPSELGPLNQGQYISFKAMIELLNNKVSGQKLFTDTFDLSLDPKLPLHLIQKLNKGKAAKILPKKIDLKRAFYRIPEQILTGLSWFFRKAIEAEALEAGLNEPDTFQHYLSIINLLYQTDIFSEDLKREFQFLMNLGVKFRLQQQMKLKGECNEVYFHEETWRKELVDQDSKIKILQESLSRWTCLYRQDASLENQNNYTDTLKNYLDALKKKAYLEKVGPDLFKPEEKMLFAQGFRSLEHIVKLTEKWIKQVKAGHEKEGLDGFPNAL